MQLRIESKDKYGEVYDNVYSAKKESSDKGIKYTYSDEYGETYVYVLRDSINIVRRGEIKSTQTLKKDTSTKFVYRTPYLSKEFTLHTKQLNIKDSEIHINYSIYEGEDLLNEINMSIKEIKNS